MFGFVRNLTMVLIIWVVMPVTCAQANAFPKDRSVAGVYEAWFNDDEIMRQGINSYVAGLQDGLWAAEYLISSRNKGGGLVFSAIRQMVMQ